MSCSKTDMSHGKTNFEIKELEPLLSAHPDNRTLWKINSQIGEFSGSGLELVFRLKNYNMHAAHPDSMKRLVKMSSVKFQVDFDSSIRKNYFPMILDSIGVLKITIPDSINTLKYESEIDVKFHHTDTIYKYKGEIIRTKSKDANNG